MCATVCTPGIPCFLLPCTWQMQLHKMNNGHIWNNEEEEEDDTEEAIQVLQAGRPLHPIQIPPSSLAWSKERVRSAQSTGTVQ